MIDLAETGKNIKNIRLSKGLSQEALALDSNLSPKWLDNIEKGKTNTTTDTIQRIAESLGVAPMALGILSLTDEEILSMVRKAKKLSKKIPENISMGETIVLLRKERKLTQLQLSELSKVSQARLRDIEHGCANTTIDRLERIAAALGMNLFALSILAIPTEDILEQVHQARTVHREKLAANGKLAAREELI